MCYGKKSQKPNYENKKGTIIAFHDVPILSKWRDSLSTVFGEKAKDLEVEGNLYYDTRKCGIGFHGDSERKKVIACSLGESRPIHWQWYFKTEPHGPRIKFMLNSGDMYIMSEKTSGYDWKKKNINIYLSTEIFYLILTSFIVFTSNPLNWMVAILMFLHLFGIALLVASPNSFYQMAEESINLDSELMENTVVIMFLVYAGMALFSRILV